MPFKLSSKSYAKLQGVHPALCKVMERAIEISTIDFGISEGLRTPERQQQLFDAGYSRTLDSKHLPNLLTGYGHAVDIFVLVNGKLSCYHKDFRPAIQAILTAAIELKVFCRFGALWVNFQDSPHIELDAHYYENKVTP